jgi:hypothetical protein
VKLPLSSFLLGYGVGACTVLLGRRLSPLLLEVATAVYRFADAVVAKTTMKQEHLANLLAEARVRARHTSGLAAH